MEANRALDIAKKAYPNEKDLKLRVAYMLGLQAGYEEARDEIELLPRINGWIARDSQELDGFLALYPYKPLKNIDSGYWGYGELSERRVFIPLPKPILQSIQWGDDEPTKVEVRIIVIKTEDGKYEK